MQGIEKYVKWDHNETMWEIQNVGQPIRQLTSSLPKISVMGRAGEDCSFNFPVHLNMFSIENLKNILLSIIKITLFHASSIPLTLSLLCHSCLVKPQLWLNPVLGLLCACTWQLNGAGNCLPPPPTHCWQVLVTFQWALSAAGKSRFP